MMSSIETGIKANILQAVVTSLLLFILYKHLIQTLGMQQIGIWSVVVACTTAARIADMGFSATLTRSISMEMKICNYEHAAKIIDTSVISLAAIYIVAAPLAYVCLYFAFTKIFNDGDLITAKNLMPYAIASLWLNIIASTLSSIADGYKLMKQRAIATTCSQVLMVSLAFLLTSAYGLQGLMISQIIQNAVCIVLLWRLCWQTNQYTKAIPLKFNFVLLIELYRKSLHNQYVNIINLLFDPISKALVTKFGGTDTAGLFEICTQIVLRIRSLLVTANQAITPFISQIDSGNANSIESYYKRNTEIIGFFSIVGFALLALSSIYISFLLFAKVNLEFLLMLNIISIGWLININSAPAYFTNLGTGKTKANTVSHLLMGTLNIFLGLILGNVFGAIGIVAAYGMSVGIGSMYLIRNFESSVSNDTKLLSLKKNGPITAVYIVSTILPSLIQIKTDMENCIFSAQFILFLFLVLFIYKNKNSRLIFHKATRR